MTIYENKNDIKLQDPRYTLCAHYKCQVVFVQPCPSKPYHFCSTDCAKESQKPRIKHCKECNSQIIGGQRKFCNGSCAAKFNNRERTPEQKVAISLRSKELIRSLSQEELLRRRTVARTKKFIADANISRILTSTEIADGYKHISAIDNLCYRDIHYLPEWNMAFNYEMLLLLSNMFAIELLKTETIHAIDTAIGKLKEMHHDEKMSADSIKHHFGVKLSHSDFRYFLTRLGIELRNYQHRVGLCHDELYKYRNASRLDIHKRHFPKIKGYELLLENEKLPKEDRAKIVKDHMVSVRYGFDNKIDPKIIKHPANCEFMTKEDNYKKGLNCSITMAELLERIANWDTLVPEAPAN